MPWIPSRTVLSVAVEWSRSPSGVSRIKLQDTSKPLGVTPECSRDSATDLGLTVEEGRIVCTATEQGHVTTLSIP